VHRPLAPPDKDLGDAAMLIHPRSDRHEPSMIWLQYRHQGLAQPVNELVDRVGLPCLPWEALEGYLRQEYELRATLADPPNRSNP
jgi:hypothetical protein